MGGWVDGIFFSAEPLKRDNLVEKEYRSQKSLPTFAGLSLQLTSLTGYRLKCDENQRKSLTI